MVFSGKNLFYLLLIATLVSLGNPAFAQEVPNFTVPDDLVDGNSIYDVGPSANDIDISYFPENPGAFQSVVLRTDSDYINLNRYHASWFVNGIKVAEGIGQRTATIKTGGYGQRTNVIILIQLPDSLIKKTFSVEPQDMTLLWEAADAYVPPFYQGKKLVPREGLIKAVAIPNFKNEKGEPFVATNGVYQWKRNDNPVSDATGYSKDSYLFRNNKIRSSEQIEVEASDTSGENQSTQSIVIKTYNPKILFYEKNSKTGIISPFSKKTLNFFGDNTIIVAQPFFFSSNDKNLNQLVFNWSMNDNPITITDTDNKKTLNLRNPGGSGAATLGINMSNPSSIFQTAASTLSIYFNKQ